MGTRVPNIYVFLHSYRHLVSHGTLRIISDRNSSITIIVIILVFIVHIKYSRMLN